MKLAFTFGSANDLGILDCVVAAEAICKDRVLEDSPVIYIPKPQQTFLCSTPLKDCLFDWDTDNLCFPYGYAVFFSKSQNGNCAVVVDKSTASIKIVSNRNIAKGERLTLNATGSEFTYAISTRLKGAIQPLFHTGMSKKLGIRGMLADRLIESREIINICPIIPVDVKEEPNLEKTTFWKYYFAYSARYHGIVLGYCSVVNHSYEPNSKYTFDFKNMLIIISAISRIDKDEEVVFNYNFFPDSRDPLPKELVDYNEHFK